MEMIGARLQAQFPQPCHCTVVPAGLHVSMAESHKRQTKMIKYSRRRNIGSEVWRSVKEGAADSKIPSSNCATSIEVIKGTRISFKELASVASLLASVFGDPRNGRDLMRGYQIRLMAALQSRILSEQSCFMLVCARTPVREGKDRAGDQIVGVMTISPGLEASGAKGYDGLEDEKCMSVCNMAVDEMHRRRGIAQRMLKAGEETLVKGLRDGKRSTMVLSVAKYNAEAIRMYEKCGYVVDESWEDPRWLESVSRGRVDVERRILMAKRLGNDQLYNANT